jgi:hypothetical protein
MRVFIRIVAFVIIILWAIYYFKPELFYFNQNKDIDTLDISKYVLTPNPAKIYAINLKVSSSTNYDTNSLAGAIQLYFDSVDIFQIKIIELLDNSSDKKITLNTYIKQLEYMQQKLESTISNLENSVIDENIKYEEYLTQKQQWDQEFNEWFYTKDANLSVAWFSTSLKNWPNATKHRIIKNAGKIALIKLKNIKLLIDTKFNILQNNENTIVDNFDVIKWDLLKKLQKLKYQLETNHYTE